MTASSMRPEHIVIAVMASNRVIGMGDGMPWNVPDEYRQFLAFIDGQTVLMGRRSWEIFGPDLTCRHTVILTRRPHLASPAGVSIHYAHDLVSGLALADELGRTVFIAGGASVYTEALEADVVDRMYLSEIRGSFAGDAWFPVFARDRWHVVQTREHPDFVFTHYRRIDRQLGCESGVVSERGG